MDNIRILTEQCSSYNNKWREFGDSMKFLTLDLARQVAIQVCRLLSTDRKVLTRALTDVNASLSNLIASTQNRLVCYVLLHDYYMHRKKTSNYSLMSFKNYVDCVYNVPELEQDSKCSKFIIRQDWRVDLPIISYNQLPTKNQLLQIIKQHNDAARGVLDACYPAQRLHIAHFRGINFRSGSDTTREVYQLNALTCHLSRVIASPAAYRMHNLAPGDGHEARESQLRSNQDLLSAVFNREAQDLLQALMVKDHKKFIRNIEQAVQPVTVTRPDGTTNQDRKQVLYWALKQLNAIGYPTCATSQMPTHALRYAAGPALKNFDAAGADKLSVEDKCVYKPDGTFKNETIGKLFISLMTPQEYVASGAFSINERYVVKHNLLYMRWEREVPIFETHMIEEVNFTLPNMSAPFGEIVRKGNRWCLSKSSFNHHRRQLTHPDCVDPVVRFAREHNFLKVVAARMSPLMLERAVQACCRRGSQLVFVKSSDPIQLSLDPPLIQDRIPLTQEEQDDLTHVRYLRIAQPADTTAVPVSTNAPMSDSASDQSSAAPNQTAQQHDMNKKSKKSKKRNRDEAGPQASKTAQKRHRSQLANCAALAQCFTPRNEQTNAAQRLRCV